MPKVLIAEDDLMIAEMIEEILVNDGYEVCGIARTVAEGVELGRRHKPDLAVLDRRLADGGLGTEIAAQLSDLNHLGVLYVTGAEPRGSVAFFVCPGSGEYDSLMTCHRPPIRLVCHVPSWKLWWWNCWPKWRI